MRIALVYARRNNPHRRQSFPPRLARALAFHLEAVSNTLNPNGHETLVCYKPQQLKKSTPEARRAKNGPCVRHAAKLTRQRTSRMKAEGRPCVCDTPSRCWPQDVTARLRMSIAPEGDSQ